MKRSITHACVLVISFGAAAAAPRAAAAQEPPPPAEGPPAADPAPAPAPAKEATEANADANEAIENDDVAHPSHPLRRGSLEPRPAAPGPVKTTFDSDPIADGAVIAVSAGFAGLLDLINSTGEVRPQQVPQNFDRSKLLSIDRGALSQAIDQNAGALSNIGLFGAIGFALVDPVLTGFRENSRQSALVDAIIYAETISLTWAMTNLAKVAVRRPRPIAYALAEANKNDPNYANTQTDSALSFFSGHASMTAAIGATATYLAFARSNGPLRPWLTLIVATGVTAFTGIERVRAGKHFPTDVIAGTIAGAGVGIVVPHLHRSEDIKQRRMWVGYAPVPQGEGGTVQLSGFF